MIYDLIIIGGGPAGIAAGIYAARQKLTVLLLAKTFGGQMSRKSTLIENYPGWQEISGADLIEKFVSHLKKFEVSIKQDEVLKVEKAGSVFSVFTKDKAKFLAKTVLVASGADPRPLDAKGEKEFIGRGVSYCVLCDGPLFANKTAAIIGGGNSALEAAIFLSGIAKKIYILEQGEKIRADIETQERIKKTGKAEIITNARVKEIKGGKFVNALIYQNGKTRKDVALSVEGVFVEIGYQPVVSFVRGLVDFNEKDEIIVEPETYRTKTSGLFAAGDCNVGKYKQIIIAAGEGAKAALSVYDYLSH